MCCYISYYFMVASAYVSDVSSYTGKITKTFLLTPKIALRRIARRDLCRMSRTPCTSKANLRTFNHRRTDPEYITYQEDKRLFSQGGFLNAAWDSSSSQISSETLIYDAYGRHLYKFWKRLSYLTPSIVFHLKKSQIRRQVVYCCHFRADDAVLTLQLL